MPDQSVAGFSLPEILITIAILAIGLVAALRVEQASVQTMREATVEGAAMQIATELADWARAGTRANSNLPAQLAALNDSTAPPLISCFVEECTVAQMLRFEWSQWQQRIGQLAPGARLVASHDGQTAVQPLLIKIIWPAGTPASLPELIIPVGPVQP